MRGAMVVTVLRWIVGALAGVFAVSALFSFALYIAFDAGLWLERARAMRQWLFVVALAWFNFEIWGRVGYTLFTWNR